MLTVLKLYIVAAAIFTFIDFIWLRFVARKVYQHYLESLLAPKPNLAAAVVFYVLFLVGLLIFVLIPAHGHHSLLWATSYGALFGFFTYLTYDLTNLATLREWPWRLSLIDIAWGSVLAATVCGLTFVIT